jgi:NADPH:quinone reductase-like Zn-dependent oxidoreductase
MKAVFVNLPASLDNLEVRQIADPGQPGAGEIRVALHATSLNFHDLLVANGSIAKDEARLLMADGAGVVEAVGDGVTEFAVGGFGGVDLLPAMAGWPTYFAGRCVHPNAR